MILTKKIGYFSLLLIIGTICMAGTIDPANQDNQYVEYAYKYNSVFRLVTKKNNKITSSSSCVAINPKWILTAAHIFENKRNHNTYVVINDKQYMVSKIFVPNDFNPNKIGYNDIALGLLDENIKTQIKYPELYKEKNEQNKIADIVGWGVSGNFNNGASFDDSKIRAGTNRISDIQKHLLMCDTSRNDQGSPLEFLISHGDSGGALFINNKLAGINSLVFSNDGKPDSSWTDDSGHTRVSLFIDWINTTISANE